MLLKVIVNPAAGRGRARRRIDAALAYLARKGAQFQVEESRSAEHLREIGRTTAAQGFERVVVCGGDGTVHQIVREMDLGRTTLGIVPMGSGDDFATSLGIPQNTERALDVIMAGSIRQVDVARANGRRFVIAASVGFDAEVARYAGEQQGVTRGSLRYVEATLRMIRRFEPFRLTIDGVAETVMFAVAANIARYGGGVRIAPAAVGDDRQLDLVVVSRASKLDLLVTMPLAYFGKHTWRSFVRTMRGPQFSLNTDEPRIVYADGEYLTDTPVTIDLDPQQLTIFSPSPHRGEGGARKRAG